jgi:hypothetical protein
VYFVQLQVGMIHYDKKVVGVFVRFRAPFLYAVIRLVHIQKSLKQTARLA